MEKNSLEEKLVRLGAKILKMHLTYPNDAEFGREARHIIKESLESTLKNHYLKKKNKDE